MNKEEVFAALDRLENDALASRDGYGDARKNADIIRTALTRPPVNAALLEALKNAENLCKAIVDGYPNTEINHIDFRVKVTKWAEDFLDDDIKAMAAAEAQPAQTVVEVENNIKLLCHECGKTHEHEYNQPPRHGSCEVCGRQNMLCTRVMTEAARIQLERQKSAAEKAGV